MPSVSLAAVLLIASLPFLVACGEDDDGGVEAEQHPLAGTPTLDPGPPDATLSVVLEEWSVTPGRSSVSPGVVRFLAENNGAETHELVVIKDGKVLGEIEGLAKGRDESMSIRLEPGKYELACLIVEKEGGKTRDHYQLGMHADFEVR